MLKYALIIFVLFPYLFTAQIGIDSIPVKNRFIFLPVLYRSPETAWAAGVSAGYYFKTSKKHNLTTRLSNIQALSLITQRHQNVEALESIIYFPQEKNILNVQSSHAYYPDKFWGLGDNTKNDWREKYTFAQFYFFPHLKHKIRPHLFVGLLYEFQYVYNITYSKGGRFDSASFSGKSNYKVSGIGGSISYDTRNAAYWPTKGVFVQTLYTGFNTKVGSDYNLGKIINDIRVFKKTIHEQVIACQFYSYITVGNDPLRELGMLGGQNNLRGFYMGRYRDKSFYSFITEYRIPVVNRISIVTFGGFGDVYKNFETISFTKLKFSGGGGLRFALLKKEKFNLRLDYGINSNYNSGVYLTVNECF